MSKLSEAVREKLGNRPVSEGARICGMADSRFRDIFYGRSKRPHPDHLRPLMALGFTWEELVMAAYGDAPAKEVKKSRPPSRNGGRQRKATASTS